MAGLKPPRRRGPCALRPQSRGAGLGTFVDYEIMSSDQQKEPILPLPVEPFDGPTADTPFPEPLDENPVASGFESDLRRDIAQAKLSLIHISEPTRLIIRSRMPSSA